MERLNLAHVDPRTLLVQADPTWFDEPGQPPLPEGLREHAATSRLGRRLLARTLAAHAPHVFAPLEPNGLAAAAAPWSRAGIATLATDLGGLAYAPAIRAEIGRDPVRRLKRVLGEGYLLALEPTVWDGVIDGVTDVRLGKALGQVLAHDDPGDIALRALFDAQGHLELQAWARAHAPALAELAALLQPRDARTAGAAHLPAAAVARVHAYHLRRAQGGH